MVGRAHQVRDVQLGDHDRVGRGLRADVVEREDVIVFINGIRRDFVRGDAAKDAILHHNPQFQLGPH